MRLFVLMPPAIHNTDFTTSFNSYDKEKRKKVSKTVSYEGAYDFFISQKLVPLAIHHPINVNETKVDRYGETTGKSKMVMPTIGCIQVKDKVQGKWMIPIFTTVDEFLKSPMGVWINKRFTNAKGEVKLDWINKWREQIRQCNDGGLTHFCVALPITLRGQGHYAEIKSNLRNHPFQGEMEEKLASKGVPKSSARQEIGLFYRTEYPMFIIPTGITKAPSYYGEGGRYFNITPMKLNSKNSPYLEEYAKNMGYELAKPVIVSKKPKMKKLTKLEKTLAPREWFMQQYMGLQSSVFNLPHEGFLVRTISQLMSCQPLYNTNSSNLSVKELGQQFNEVLSHILIQYVNPNSPPQIRSDFAEYMEQNLPSFPSKNTLWPLDMVNMKSLGDLKGGMNAMWEQQNKTPPYEQANQKYTYTSTSLPPSLLLLSLESYGEALNKDYIQRFIKAGAENLVEDDALHQYHCYFWDDDEMKIGLMNHGFLNFISPTLWDKN